MYSYFHKLNIDRQFKKICFTQLKETSLESADPKCTSYEYETCTMKTDPSNKPTIEIGFCIAIII